MIHCPKIDEVVAANVSKDAERSDQATSRLQQFWLDAAAPLMMLLKRDEEF